MIHHFQIVYVYLCIPHIQNIKIFTLPDFLSSHTNEMSTVLKIKILIIGLCIITQKFKIP